jgi:catechol 2,3-dioxygenase-like lactoylglutathione lyase family enzyme
MSLIKIEDIAFVRFRAPDLDRMRGFLQDFGLQVTHQDPRRLFARGAGPSPVLHMTDLGEPGFAGLGLRAASLDDLETLARAEGAAVAPLDAPGGGKVVTLHDPDGHRIEVVAGQQASDASPLPAHPSWNSASDRGRLRQLKRTAIGPSHVVRLGHCVLKVSDFRASERWYKDRFGFITSDEIALSPTLSLGAFLRCDRGETPTDHHTLFIVQHPAGPGFIHAAFEVADLDDLMAGHDRLKSAGATPEWGVGRHLLGSQVFDYWLDPWGHTLEHWTDGDLLTTADGSRTASLQNIIDVQWGPPPPPTLG